MPLPSHLQQIVADEHMLRGFNWLGVAPELCRCPVVALTPRIVFELSVLDNALLRGRPATPADLFEFLWRLHPNFRREDGDMPNRPSGKGSALLAFFARRWLRRHVRQLSLWPAESRIREWLDANWQDEPAEVTRDHAPETPFPPSVPHMLDSVCDWWGNRYGVDPRTALDVPLALIFQCRRLIAIRNGEKVIDRSRKPITDWLLQQRRN
jgi:hypothetical protein